MYPLKFISNNFLFLDINLHNPIVKVTLPILTIIAVIVISKLRFNISLREDYMLKRPAINKALLWLFISIGWMLITDYFMNWRGEWNFVPWQNQPLYVSILRVLAVVILGPIAEELLFRGFLFYRLKRLKIVNEWFVVIIVAAFWACIHYTYPVTVIAIIFVDGILLGAALLKSRSLVVPILMHISWNLYAIW